MLVATKKITIAIAAIILAMAAIWYALSILSFNSLSESEASWWLRVSEVVLLVFAALLTLGLIGEWPDSAAWKKRFIYKVAKSCVIIGVVGELLGDAGIFETSARLQVLQETAIKKANEDLEKERQKTSARPWTKEQFDGLRRIGFAQGLRSCAVWLLMRRRNVRECV
jgi:cytochrome c-type biogenesis protein CcmH/NrfG